jgi:hypothetical protein
VALEFERLLDTKNSKNAKMILLSDDIGHWPQLEDPSSVVKHYSNFLNEK